MAEALKAKCRGEACLARPRSGIRTAHSVQSTIVSAALPDLSLRGPKGAVAISCDRSRFRRKFPVIRHCTVRLPRRFAPRNDTSGSAVVHQCPPAVECLCTRRSVSAATDAIGAYRFIDGRYESEVPPRDCHVGRWPPRNDKSEAGFILTKACTGRRRCAGRGMPLPYNARLEIGVLFILKSSVFIIHLFLHAPPLQRTTDSPAISLKIIQNSIILEATAPCRTIFTRK